MSLEYMGLPNRCEHGEYKDKKCDKCEIELLRSLLTTACDAWECGKQTTYDGVEVLGFRDASLPVAWYVAVRKLVYGNVDNDEIVIDEKTAEKVRRQMEK